MKLKNLSVTWSPTTGVLWIHAEQSRTQIASMLFTGLFLCHPLCY